MNAVNRRAAGLPDPILEQVVEPLASYICATEQPRAALLSVLAVLNRSIRETNRIANAQYHHFSEAHW